MRITTLPLLLPLLAGCVAPATVSEPARSEDEATWEAADLLLPSPVPWSGAHADYSDEAAALSQQVDALRARVEGAPEVWIYRQQLAGALLTRARLTGDWDDYERADAELDAALAQPLAAPWSTLASLNYSMHRFDALPELIDRIAGGFPASDHRVADVSQRRGNLALVQGRYEEAGDELGRARDLHATPGSLSSLAVYHWRVGDFVGAEELFVAAAGAYHAPPAEPRAWVHLNLGLLDLDRGRWPEALAHYRDAERELSGYWLVDEHVAEALVLLGETDEAEALYRDVIARTDAPEFMDALSGLLAADGRAEEAASWLAAARERWETALVRFPEAAYGHALSHYLDAGDLPERALELAAANHALRPDGESKVLLARALLALDRADEALPLLEEALASPYESAALHAVAAAAYAALGMDAAAEDQRAAALAINPHALD
jgi:tetratricopeptide (TPR) repeat protein